MINKKVEDAINEQINKEIYSAYLYLSMAADFRDKNFDGFANWMEIQSQEEVNHAMRLYNYLNERGGRVILEAIEKPEDEWDSPLDAFQAAYDHEQYVTKSINNLYDLAEEENDRATMNMLNWFVEEQVEEEDTASQIVEQIKMVKDSPNGLMMLNNKLGERGSGNSTESEDSTEE